MERIMKKFLTLFVVVATITMVAAPVFAHHGRGQTYAMDQTITLKGTVSEVVWRNPTSYTMWT